MQFYHDAICQDLERRRHSTPHTRAEQVSDGVHMELLLKVWLKQINRLVAYPDGLQNLLWETDKPGLRIQRRDHLLVGKAPVAVGYCARR
jgi:hypothetical protein